jgi:hypothetical protein
MSKIAIQAATAAALAGGAALAYPAFFRRCCLSWGATAKEVARKLPATSCWPTPPSVDSSRFH